MNEVGQIRQDCHICGTPLEYLEQGIPVRCTVCGREERGNVLCPEGHYVCEACHSPDFLTSLRTFLRAVSSYWGLSGVCGVVPALGACYSVLVGARCGLGPQTMATMELTGRLGLVTAEHAEPGCCKAYVRACLATTTEYIRETLDIELPDPAHARCLHHTQHPHGCRGFACPWYPDVSTGQDAGLQETGDGG